MNNAQHPGSAALTDDQSKYNLIMDLTSMNPNIALSVASIHDQSLFANRSKLVGEDLLELAARYSNNMIVELTNASRPAGSMITNRWHLHRALENAFKSRSQNTGKTLEQVKGEFFAMRKSKGVRSNIKVNDNLRRNLTRNPVDSEHTGDTTEEEFDDEDAFANPKSLRGDALIALAERYSNVDIANRTAAFAKEGDKLLGARAWYSRLNRALKARAYITGESFDSLRDALHEARKRNMVKQYNYTGGSRTSSMASGTNKMTLVGSMPQAAVAVDASSSPIEDDGFDHTGDTTEEEGEDGVNMSDVQGFDAQAGFTANEVEAANGLLALSNHSKVTQAAMVLMAMI